MQLLSLSLTDLSSGYEKLSSFDQELRTRQRLPKLRAYAEKRSAYEVSQADFLKKNKQKRAVLITIGLAASFFSIFGLIALALNYSHLAKMGDAFSNIVRLGPIFLLGGAGCILILAGAAFFWPLPKAPVVPKNPIQENQKAQYPSLYKEWSKNLLGKFPEKQSDEGATGEKLFVQTLEQIQDKGFILYRLVQNRGDDLDVVIVGSKGIWLFEVKYWSGNIAWEDGEWHKRKSYFGRGGKEKTETMQINQPPDLQWRRMRDELVYTLNRHSGSLLRKQPGLTNIHGGIVFTHHDAEITIPKGAGFSWGNTSFWYQNYQNSPEDPLFTDPQVVFRILDVLLDRHQKVTAIKPTLSLAKIADQLIRETNTP